MAKPKLALIPAAQGDKFYSVLPSDGVGDFDFTRASTGTRIAPTGLIEEVASGDSRLNYDLLNGKVVNCPHYLLEPARTNSITYSEDFSNAYWLSGATPNNEVSPNGTLTAYTNLATGIYPVNQTSIDCTIVNTGSIFAKSNPNGSNIMTLNLNRYGSGDAVICTFDLLLGTFGTVANNGTASQGTAKIENFGNGWYRCSLSGICSTTSGGLSFNPIGDCFIYGAQVEAGSYPTSYIPTNGTAITRAAETATGSGDAATFNDSEGVLMAEISALADDGTFRFLGLSDGTTSNRVSVYFDNLNKLSASVPDVAAFSSNVNIKDNNKVAFKYKSGGYSFYVNGFELGTSTSTAGLHSGLNTLNFDFGGGSDDFYGKTREVQYFDSALTDAQLETLTSWTSLQEMITSQLYTNY